LVRRDVLRRRQCWQIGSLQAAPHHREAPDWQHACLRSGLLTWYSGRLRRIQLLCTSFLAWITAQFKYWRVWTAAACLPRCRNHAPPVFAPAVRLCSSSSLPCAAQPIPTASGAISRSMSQPGIVSANGGCGLFAELSSPASSCQQSGETACVTGVGRVFRSGLPRLTPADKVQ